VKASEPEFDLTAKYTTEDYGGIAFYCVGYEQIHDEDYEWTGIAVENKDRVRCIMVGDDTVFTFDVEDLTKIDDDSYCPECGQIGCKAYG
jgi:hypothetical protein